MLPAVSIGLPVFNGSSTLARALESLLAQSFSDFELVISDNASTDATRDLCEAYAAVDKRIRYVRHAGNIGATANFEFLLDCTQAELFMWAAHDDTRDPSFLATAVAALAARQDCVLAASDVSLVDSAGRHVGLHRLTKGIESVRVSTRYRTIVRNGGWSAIYGLIRRNAVARTRRLATTIGSIAPDYRLIELCLQGPFAYMENDLFTCEVREVRDKEVLEEYLNPDVKLHDTSFRWLFFDLLRLSGRYGLPPLERAGLQLEFLASAKSPGTLHDFLSSRNTEASLAASAACNKLLALKLGFQRAVFIGPSKWSLLLQRRALTKELQDCRATLINRNRSLEQATKDLVETNNRLQRL